MYTTSLKNMDLMEKGEVFETQDWNGLTDEEIRSLYQIQLKKELTHSSWTDKHLIIIGQRTRIIVLTGRCFFSQFVTKDQAKKNK